MTIDIGKLKARWGWTSLLALVVMGALWAIDTSIIARSGQGIMQWEAARNAPEMNRLISAWIATGAAPRMAFLLGLDYLYMPSYGFALFYGTLAAREAFARRPGAARRLLTTLAFAPLVGAVFDVFENAFEAKMLFAGSVSPQLASIAYATTMMKFAFIAIGLACSLAAIVGLFMGRLKRP